MKISRPIYIVIAGFILRILFLLFGAEVYYGKEDFYLGGDTNWWVVNIVNLIENGVYTDQIGSEYGYFTRTPGYSFLIGFFYLITNKDMDLALKLIPFFQVLVDTISIYLIFNIAKNLFKDSIAPIITSVLYAFYPFIIVWTAIDYAESSSVFLFLLSIYLLQKAKSKKSYVLTGVILSLAILTRIQLILAIPIFCCIVLWKTYQETNKIFNYKIILFTLSIIFIYGSWPIRNYVNHNKLIFSQHLGDRQHWSPDYIKFMEYIWAVKVDYEPQYSQIISGEGSVLFPETSYKTPEDSILLDSVVNLARTCGEGFSYFAHSAGYRSDVVIRGENDCNDKIVALFDHLILNQKKNNTLSYYFLVPLGNLKKAVFKNQLYKSSSSFISNIGFILFSYRTFLILIGIFGSAYLLFHKNTITDNQIFTVIVSYVIVWYIFQAFFYRNMEIRYLLHADILLLIPAGYIFSLIIKRLTKLPL